MDFPVWCELVCSKCSGTCAGRFNFKDLRKRQMAESAKADGWKLVKVDGYKDWLCAKCAKPRQS